jgi:hypothetical protein
MDSSLIDRGLKDGLIAEGTAARMRADAARM